MRRAFVLLGLLAFWSTLAIATVPPGFPDLTKGNVDGHVALVYWPAQMPVPPKNEPRPLQSAAGCTVRMVPVPDFDRELRFDCGKWFTPPAGRYNFWLETADQMSPVVSMVTFAVRPFEGRGVGAIIPVAPAGKIAIPAGKSMPDTEDLRLLSLEATAAWKMGTPRVFDRRVKAADAHKPVQMPEGRVVVGRFDHATGDAVALSPVIDLKAGAPAYVWPEAPRDSDVLVILDKPGELQTSKPLDVHLTIDKRPPDALLDGLERMIAIWYGLESRTATVAFQSTNAFWGGRDLRLVRGKVTTVRDRLQPLPKVRVSINTPPDATLPDNLFVEIAGRRISVNSGVNEITGLPPQAMPVVLRIGEWKFTKDVDLSNGEDGAVTFDLEPVNVTGSVFYGDDRAAADIAFFQGGSDWVVVRTDDRGDYATTFWWPDERHARVTLRNRSVPPFTDPFREILKSGRVDFHVPRTDYVVHVRDAITGRPIAGATVTAGSIWTDDSDRKGQQVEQAITDDSGKAVLPPVRTGELVVDARAPKYAALRDALHLNVDDAHHDLDIALEPLHAAAGLRLVLANQTAAARAEIWAFDGAMHPLWRGAADDGGIVELPEVARNAVLLIRHPDAASLARSWNGDEVWTLDPPAEPLTIVTERAGVQIGLWLDEVRLSGPSLSFATWSNPATVGDGRWTGRNLPRRGARVLAGNMDAVATTIDYPWLAAVHLRAH